MKGTHSSKAFIVLSFHGSIELYRYCFNFVVFDELYINLGDSVLEV